MGSTPVLLLGYNRPDQAARLIEAVRHYEPSRVYVACDGPKLDQNSDLELCLETRRRLLEGIDWSAKISTRFLDVNQGCRLAVSGALTWFFQREPSGIVLEDDCQPDPTFFQFCETLLIRYADVETVGAICGTNFGIGVTEQSYWASSSTFSWGWASWRRAWQLYRDDPWSGGLSERLRLVCGSHPRDLVMMLHRAALTLNLDLNILDSWAYRWDFSLRSARKLSLIPARNLVLNSGFDGRATHTNSGKLGRILVLESLEFPIVHPEVLSRDGARERRVYRLLAGGSWTLAFFRGVRSLVVSVVQAASAMLTR